MKPRIEFPAAALLFVAILVSPSTTTARLRFQAPYYVFPTPVSVIGVTIDDFNEDGRLDAAASASNGTIVVRLGDGTGSILPVLGQGATVTTSPIVAGDVNHDGNLDLAVAARSPSSLTIYLGNGDGTFGPRADFPMPASARAVVLADFNEDGHLDAAAAGYGSEQGCLSAWLGNGAGQFSERVDFIAFPVNPVGIITADANSDGHADLIYISLPDWDTQRLKVRLGNGDGTFGSPVGSSILLYPHGLTGGDLNGDGVFDCVTVDSDTRNISVGMGRGDGSFQMTAYDVPVFPYKPYAATLGDFNDDASLDIAVTIDAGVTMIFLNTGKGIFTRSGTLNGGSGTGLQAADMNGDGRLDLVHAGGGFTMQIGNGDGTFGIPRFGVGTNPAGLAMGDFDRDGRPDVLTVNEYDRTLSIRLGQPGRDFAPRVDHPIAEGPTGLSAGDLNHDGFPDAVVTNWECVSRLLGDGAGGFGPRADVTMAGARDPQLADIDGDGHLDVVTANGSTSIVSILTGDGNGGFAPPATLAVPSPPAAVCAVDVTGDNLPDIVTANSSAGSISLFRNLGGGAFAPRIDTPVGTDPWDMDMGDVDNDGETDLVVARRTGGALSVFKGDGNGAFAHSLDVGLGYPQAITLFDVNGDGRLDLVGISGACACLFYGNGDGTFSAPEYYGSGRYPNRAAAADVDLDGQPDLVLPNYGNDSAYESSFPGCFTVLWNNSEQPIPVALLSFSAVREANGARVTWEVPEAARRNFYALFRGSGIRDRERLPVADFTGQLRYEAWDPGAPAGDVDYWLREMSPAGSERWFGPVSLSDAPPVPVRLTACPNPARGTVTLSFGLAEASPIRIDVFDAAGKRVARLIDGTLASGMQVLDWNAVDGSGQRLPAGHYFIHLQGPDGVQTRKVVVLP